MEQTLQLTGRELQIVRFITQGMTTPQIAETLSLSPETVKWYRKKILAKFSASTSAEMVRKSIEQGIL
jgi:DNA-binding CsgD family transcriptional regulator